MSDRDTAAVGSPPGDTDEGVGRLRSGSVGLLGMIGIAVGPQAPTGGINLLPAIMAGIVGAAGPLAFLLGMVAMAFAAYALVIFTRRIASAGQLYSYAGAAIGSGYGFVVGFAWAVGFATVAGWLSIQDGDYLVALFEPAGVHLPWVGMTVLMWIVMVVVTYQSLNVSAITVIVVETFGLLLMLGVAAVVIGHGGYHGHGLSWKPFTLGGASFATVTSGVVFAFTSFSGFETAGTAGEEAKRATWYVPVAIFAALLVSGSIYVFMTWVETVSFSSSHALASQTAPLVAVASRYVGGWMGTVMNVAALVSGFGAQLACLAGAARVFFALSRDGLAGHPRAVMTKVDRRVGTPVAALAVASFGSAIAAFAFIGAGPLGSITDVSTYGADIGVITYLLIVVAGVVFCWRHVRKAIHIVVLLVGVGVMGYVVKSSLYPVPAAPLDYAMYAALATFAAGIVLLVVFPQVRRRLRSSQDFGPRWQESTQEAADA
jgi:amino acid transporter